MNQKRKSQEEIMKHVQRILEERGRKALEMARKTVLEEEIESKEVREATKYFMTEYWHDVARPALLSLVCEAVGGNPSITTPIAIPMTLISGAIDIHDDIIDQSKNKGSRPTVLGKFGKEIALLVGDALLFKGFVLLHEAVEKGIPAEKLAAVMNLVKETFFELGDAEALELQFRGRTNITPEDHIRVLRKKAADVEAHTRISAILGDGSKEEIEALGEYGRLLGMLILLRDDVIDMIDPEELVHRIAREHLPLALLYPLQDPTTKSTLDPLLLKDPITREVANTILGITDKSGGLKRVQTLMEELAENALKRLENIRYNQEPLKLLATALVLSSKELENLASTTNQT